MMTCSRRGPCAPRISVCSMSAERDGPVIMLTTRGSMPVPNLSRSRAKRSFEVAGDVLGIEHDDVIVGQEIERRRVVRPGREHQRAGFGDRAESMRHRRQLAAVGASALKRRARARAPTAAPPARGSSPTAHRQRQIVPPQKVRDGAGTSSRLATLVAACPPRLPACARTARARCRRRQMAARRHDAARMPLKSGRQRPCGAALPCP